MRTKWGSTVILAAVISMAGLGQSAWAQAYPGGYAAGPSAAGYGAYPGPAAYGGAMPPGYGAVPAAGYANSAGYFAPTAGPYAAPGAMAYDPYVMQAGYDPAAMAAMGAGHGPNMMSGEMMDYQGAGPGFEGGYGGVCPYCGGAGCPQCMGGDGPRTADWIRDWILPYNEGGRCAPRWYDVHVEYMYLQRDTVSRTVNLSSDGPAGFGAPVIVLSSNNLDFDEQPGFRFTGALQVLTAYALEFTYFGMFSWSSRADATSAFNDLFSVYSDFGNNPPGGFDETDNAFLHRITYSSDFDNFELNLRKRWTGANCRLQGSWLMGCRYFWMDEDFSYETYTNNGNSDTRVNASNSMTGFQLGGDLWASIIPGYSVGADLKAAILGNHADQSTNIFASTTPPNPGTTFSESFTRTNAALLAEANIMSIYRINPHWTIRSGYHFLYVDGVALAIENFNPVPPNTFVGAAARRQTQINTGGDVFFHGMSVGLEYMW